MDVLWRDRAQRLERTNEDVVSASTQQPLPVAGDTSGRSGRGLIQRVMLRRCERRAVVVGLLAAVVVEPVFCGLVTGDPRMPGRFGVGGGVLARRVITTADVAALSTPAQVKPPPAPLFTLRTAGTARRDSRVDSGVFSHRLHATRPWAPAQ